MRSIGIDLHKDKFTACILDNGRKEIREYQLSKIDHFKKFLRSDDRVAVEMLSFTRNFVNKLDGIVKPVIVNPTQFKVISQSKKKTDKNDADKIALYLEKDMLPEVKMPDEEIAQIRSIANTRHKFVEMRTMLKNKIHSILNSNGIITRREDFSGDKSLEKVKKYDLNSGSKLELEVTVELIKKYNEQIKKLEDELISRGSKLKGFENITSIKGIGGKSGTILLSAIADIDDFESEKKLAAYFGIVPRVRQSNLTLHMGRITRQGNKLARTTLVQCTLIAIKYSNYFRTFYDKIKNKKGSGKAIIATAKKLLYLIFYILKNDLIFEDFPNYKYRRA